MPDLTRIQIVVFLQSCDLFSFCRAEEILQIAGIAREKNYAAGERIYGMNDPAEMLYAVVHGEIRLRNAEGNGSTLGALRTFGVREILCGRLRGEEAVAESDTMLLTIEAEDFFDLLANNIDIVKALFRHLLEEPTS